MTMDRLPHRHVLDPNLTEPDHLILQSILSKLKSIDDNTEHHVQPFQDTDEQILKRMREANNPVHAGFVATIFLTWDARDLAKSPMILQVVLHKYTMWAKTVVRHETDVVMLTHLLLYLFTSVPSAICLYLNFTYLHGFLHTILHVWYAGSYTLMMHQHIHMKGVLAKKYAWLDHLFPYITDPLMGHTWNSYYFHHVKHHHVEGNGPYDLSSTIRYQRDSTWNFCQYLGRFLLFGWLELPLYFCRKGQTSSACKVAISELSNMMLYLLSTQINPRATTFVFLLPLFVMRIGLMIGNWGQHAFIDGIEPDSDYRSSITLIDVASNRYCFNDGYHTSHHLNPKRHWRQHPISFMEQKRVYARESALVFCNIDYLMITVKLLQRDYIYLARCLVAIGDQIGMSIPDIAAMLETKTRRFSEDEIRKKFKVS